MPKVPTSTDATSRVSQQDSYQHGARSPEEDWSGPDSEVEPVGQNGSKAGSGLKRKRPTTVSCELCKLRKVKCDRVQPSCGWCSRNGQLCEYKERKKPGLRAGYGKELEQRLDKLEAIIQSQGRIIETYVLQNQPRPNHEFSDGGAPSYTSPSEPSAIHDPSPRTTFSFQDHTSLSIAPRNSDAGSINRETTFIPSPTETSVPNAVQSQRHEHIPSSADLSRIHDTSQDYTKNDSSLNVPLEIFSDQRQSLADPDLDLPPYDLLYALVDLYFEHINVWCPILHRRTTMDTFFGPSPLQEADRVVLYAIVATTLRFSSDKRLTEQSRTRYYNSSKQKVILYGLENSSVQSLQALVILALDFVGSSNGPPGWKLLALIARSVVQLGLAVESGSALISSAYPSIYTLRAVILPEPSNWIEDEGRRRLFWSVYMLDRYSTIATAFDFALDDKDIDRRLPCKDEFFSKNQPVETRYFRRHHERTDFVIQSQNVGWFGFYVDILGILSRIHIFLKRPVDIGSLSDVEEWQSTYRKLGNEITSWEFSLPAEYALENGSRLFSPARSSRNIYCGWVMLHAAYQTAVIRLHSSAAYPTTRSPIFTPSYGASQQCLMAVDNILSLSRFVLNNNMLDKLGPPFAFSLWVSARLLLVHGSTIAHTVSPDIVFFVDTLSRMGKYWKVAERYSTILQRVLDEFADYQRSVETDRDRSTPSSVKILADMRRCAFDLDFLISRQPRTSPSTHPSSSSLSLPNNAIPTDLLNSKNPTARNPALNELEYLDVFGFFNVPRIPILPMEDEPSTTNINLTDSNENTNASSTANNNNNPMSIHGLTTAEPNSASTAPTATATGTGTGGTTTPHPHGNEFNITNYLIPTPETDWLFRPGS
ncbi:C6 transcription factor [Paecilomyces variotii No. 5]|uniref:C6 transcription factor n=1 Tax=Byssochlamys spectabilis (strain No. 5 / NBRC 109023) TaxID=1356009 RepID=V5G7W5_BYSSN|nr:C6 transcription factor [Paecilomyces variotii No. 5]